MSKSKLAALSRSLAAATGSDRALDAAIAETLDAPEATYSSSVDACLDLLHRVLPGWGWHVGYGPLGILPYATVQRGEARFEASAATVPLALLDAIVAALEAGPDSEKT